MTPLLLLLIPALAAADQLPEVVGLTGEADYRFVKLRWEYPVGSLPSLYGFQVHYCELQAWGPNRCRTKMIDDSSGMQGLANTSPYRMYTIIINGLRMATNYSFEVWPTEARRTRYLMDKTHTRRILITTKGFSARASLCLPDVSEVEVSTGPFFNGRIAVETGGEREGCSVDGDGESPKESYTLRIRHTLCGSKVNRTSVATFILVQENLPILTHSTRRFLVLCTFHPETLTVRAGLNLPSTSPGSVISQSSEPVIIPELSHNDVHAAPLQQDQQDYSNISEETEAQVVLSTIAVVAGIVGIGLTVWWFLPSKPTSEDCAATVYDNYENTLRDSLSDTDTSLQGLESRETEIDRGVCNEGLRDSTVFTICQANPQQSSTCITIESQSHSEA